MRHVWKILGLFVFMFVIFAVNALAQGTITPPSQDEIDVFLHSLAGIGGLKGVAIVLLIVQGLMLLFRSHLADFAGKYRLLIVTFLTLVAALVMGMSSGQTPLAALLSGSALTTLQVFMNQLYNQFFVKTA